MTRKLTITLAAVGLLVGATLPALGQNRPPRAPRSGVHDITIHEHLQAPVAGAQSAPTQHPRSKTVRYSDQDLESRDGARVVVRRIRNAAMAVCGPSRGRRPLSDRSQHQQCVQQAMDEAVQGMNAPMVTQVYQEVHG